MRRARTLAVLLTCLGVLATAAPSVAAPPGHGAGDWAPLRARLAAIAHTTEAQVGVSVQNLAAGGHRQRIEFRARTRMPSASVIKLPILAELLRMAERGELSLAERVRVDRSDVVGGTGQLQHEKLPQDVSLHRLARYMIIYSDNTATNLLIDRIGFGPVNALIRSLGLHATVLQRKMMDTEAQQHGKENYLDAADIAKLLRALWDGRLLAGPARAIALGFLRDQRLNELIPAALPPGAPVAHKTGTLDDLVTHDAGYYLVPGSEVLVVFTTRGTTAAGTDAVHRMARAVWDFTQRGAR
ncbi:serine hydrolase [Sciscionella marina]|uniref:serine hydrolase n=1 Tax=Sciscionella marina TaxID=508770 RepID=UPI000369F9CB|nr:serine hydrolase [Sciscionella marina]